MLIGAGLAPAAAPEILIDREAVEDAAVIAEMIKGIDVGARMGVHRNRVAGIGNEFVAGFADAHDIIDPLAARRMGHPHLVGLILG